VCRPESALCGVMREISLALVSLVLLDGCSTAPEPSNVVSACGLDQRDGWMRSSPPTNSRLLLADLRRDNPFKNEPDLSRTYLSWFSAAEGTRLAYCEYTGTSSCGLGTTATFGRSQDAWKKDEGVIVNLCSQH
jgi:hypothetical protein